MGTKNHTHVMTNMFLKKKKSDDKHQHAYLKLGETSNVNAHNKRTKISLVTRTRDTGE